MAGGVEEGEGGVNVDSAKTITLVSHCFGYGGIDLGLREVFRERLRCISSSEIEMYAVWNALAKVEQGLFDAPFPIWSDIKSFPFASFHGKVGIYSAGFPCQPFSCAGKGEADNDPRHLFPYIKRGCEQMRPALVFLENVGGIVNARLKSEGWNDPVGTPVLLHVLRELERIGYSPTWGVFSAAEVGASHQRKRVFILAKLAHTEGERGFQAAERREPGQSMSDMDCNAVDDALSQFRRASRADCAEGFATASLESAGEQLANAKELRRQQSWASRQGRNGLENGSVGVGQADSDSTGSQGRSLPECERGGEWASRQGLPAFPPGPDATEQWREIIERYPWLAPATTEAEIESVVCRMADGSSKFLDGRRSRVDQLRLLGNGCVPKTVATAFRVLSKRLGFEF